MEITLVQATTGGPESAVVSFEVSLDNGLAGDITGFAIHEGVAGQNGPALIQTQLSADGQAPAGNTLSGQMLITGSSQLEALQAMVEGPQGSYVLLTGASHPDGLLRGQLSESGDMSGEMDNLSDRLERIEKQLNVIQRMVRSVGRVLGIDPSFLPEPESDTEGTGSDSFNAVSP